MNYVTTRIIVLAGAAALVGMPTLFGETHKRASAPIVITPPAVPDGSNFSRAPFPASRPQNDVTPPNGEAFDQEMPPNTPSTTPDPIPPPEATVAILQPRVAPGMMPTGRPTVAASAALMPSQVEMSIRNAPFESRDNLVDDIRVRERQSETTLREFRRSESQMSEQGRTQFRAESDQVKAAQKALDKSIHRAERASASDWEQARAQLAGDYDAYASTVAQIDAAVGVAPVR
jgi:hypothetical protein